MGSFASAVVRLVGPFHCSWLVAKKTFIRVCIRTDSVGQLGRVSFVPAFSFFGWSDASIDPEHAIEPHRAPLSKQWHEGRITCAVGGRGCGPCTRIEKTRKSAQRIFSRLWDGRARGRAVSYYWPPAPTGPFTR